MTPATGKRLTLRRLNSKDFENMRLLESDPDVMRFTPSRVPQTPEQTRTKLQTLIDNETKHQPMGVWAVELIEQNVRDPKVIENNKADNKKFVAWIMLLKTDLEFPEVGFMVVKKFWNQGIASEALEIIIDFAFDKLKLKGISARTGLENFGSIRTLEKAGFKYKGNMTVPDKILGGSVELKVFELLS